MKGSSSVTSEEKIKEKDLDLEKGHPYKDKRKYPGFGKNIKSYCNEYTDYTGIHGFRYMGEKNRSYIERFTWLVLFCVSLYLCTDLIVQTWIKWDRSPVLVSFARSPTPVWQVPFPAITICSETKTAQKEYNFTDIYNRNEKNPGNLTEDELKIFSDMPLICHNLDNVEGNKTTDYETIEYLMGVAPKFKDMFFDCLWRIRNYSLYCSDLFTPLLTEEGLCFTFNMLDKQELVRDSVFLHSNYMSHGQKSEGWSLENGYPKNTPKDTFPRRALSAGSSAGFSLILLNTLQDFDYICSGPVQGFKVHLHNPSEVPRVGMQFFRAPINQDIVVSVKPDMMTTSEGLKAYDPMRRQCFFSNEKYLSFYKNYTQQNCEIECIANATLAKCGCVAYHMPHTENTPICGSGSIPCMMQAESDLLDFEVEAGLNNMESKYQNDLNITDCNCLPACTSLTYNAETSQADLRWVEELKALDFGSIDELSGFQLTTLTFFFKDQQFITSERNELYGKTEFLANCGGILGLFTGFSFLSIVEIVYFLSLRLMCNVKKYGRRYWSGTSDLINDDGYLHP